MQYFECSLTAFPPCRATRWTVVSPTKSSPPALKEKNHSNNVFFCLFFAGNLRHYEDVVRIHRQGLGQPKE